MKKINITLFNNVDIDFDYYKNELLETRDIEDEEDVTDNDVWDFIWKCVHDDWEALTTNLRYSKYNDEYFVITGSLGLWNGNPLIEPTTCSSLIDAIWKCVNGCDYCKVKQVNGHLEVYGYHHDGCNCFEIHLLNDSGIRAMERINEGWGKANLEDRHYHKAISGYVF